MPRRRLIILFPTIVGGLCYLGFVLFTAGTSDSAYRQDRARDRATAKYLDSIGELAHDESAILRYSGDERLMAFAEGKFRRTCASCHGSAGQGLVGPNLTDDAWKNVTEVSGLYLIISEGANHGAMPPWKHQLQPNDIVLLASYVVSLRGSTPAGGKAPEGDVLPPWPETPARVDPDD